MNAFDPLKMLDCDHNAFRVEPGDLTQRIVCAGCGGIPNQGMSCIQNPDLMPASMPRESYATTEDLAAYVPRKGTVPRPAPILLGSEE